MTRDEKLGGCRLADGPVVGQFEFLVYCARIKKFKLAYYE